MTKIIRKSEELSALGLLNTSERHIRYVERVDVMCQKCKTTVGCVTFGNLITKMKRSNIGWCCKSCQNTLNSLAAKARLAKHNPWTGRKHSTETIEKIKSTRELASRKAEDTCLRKYGVKRKSQLQETKEKQKNTNLARYGERSFLATEAGRAASKKTNMELYGAENVANSEKIREKKKKVALNRWGVDNYFKTLAFKESMRGENHPSYRHTEEMYKTSRGELLVHLCKKHNKNLSNSIRVFNRYGEEAFYKYLEGEHGGSSLEQLGVELFGVERWDKETPPIKRRPDFKIGNIFVNLDGLYFHSEKNREPNYHMDLREQFEKQGWRILQFYEDEVTVSGAIVQSIVAGMVGKHRKIHARKCKISKLNNREMCDFFDKNHLMGNYGAAKGFGLFNDGILVCSISVRKYKDYLEISRFGSLLNTRVVGGFSKLLKFIIESYKPTKIVSFCDLRYGTGDVYKKAGFVLEGVTRGWCWTDGFERFNRLRCRANMDERGMSERQYSEELKWYRIYDAGQAKFTLNLTTRETR